MKDKLLQSEQGNVLVYALLTIAAILSSSIVISNIINGSIGHSGLIASSEEAFYSAESGLEKTLYTIRKEDNLPQSGSCDIDNIDCEVEVSNDKVNYLMLDLERNQSVQIDLFDPENNLHSSGVDSFAMEWANSQTWLEVSIVEWPNDYVFSWPNLLGQVNVDDLPTQKFLYSGGQDFNLAINNYFVKTKNYRVRIKALYGNADDLIIKLYGTDNGGVPIAFPNYLTIDAVGKYRDSSQRLSVEMPRYSSLLGLFDYVLFSESVITK